MATDGWTDALAVSELEDRRSVRVDVEDQPVLLVRDGERLFAIGARCTHQGAPRVKGPLRFGALDQVTCPAHGSVFALADGRVLRGPAARPEPAYDVGVVDGRIELHPRA